MNEMTKEDLDYFGTARYSDELMCHVHQISYLMAEQTGFVMMFDDHCTDMLGAIALFERVDKNVRKIITYCAGSPIPDTCYVKYSDGWHAIRGFHLSRVATTKLLNDAVNSIEAAKPLPF